MSDKQGSQPRAVDLVAAVGGAAPLVVVAGQALAAGVDSPTVVLVEGISDQVALEAIAERRGRNLPAEGISVVPIGGAMNIGRFLDLFGPQGLDVRLAGLCDAGEESQFRLGLGEFGSVNGASGGKLVKLDAATGTIRPEFTVSVTSTVKDMVLRGNRLFVAGSFTEVNHEVRLGLAALDPDTGALDSSLTVSFTDPRQGLSPRVEAIDATPDDSTLVAIGNFTEVDGQDRHQIALVNIAARPARLHDWHTDRYNPGPEKCSSAFDTHMRDVDLSPDGSWFVVVTTGAYSRGTLCDTAARWETAARGMNLQPTWVDYSGGDSFTGVAVTGAAVYVNGHMRWLNNAFPQSTGPEEAPGPGNVPREGIAALDPASGLPLPWNPGRERGEGEYAFTATPDGLWTGSDTSRIGGEQHERIAFFPLAGGSTVPPVAVAGLPGDLYSLELDSSLARRWFDGQRMGERSELSDPTDWSRTRGAFAVNGRLYTGRDDGSLEVRGFDGAQFGNASPVDLKGLTSTQFPISKATGMFYDNGRLYYGVSGDRNLYYRYFTPVDDTVGAETVFAPEDGGVNWGTVKGMTLSAGRLYYVLGDDLHAMEFIDGRPRPDTAVVVAQGSATSSWASRGMFVPSGGCSQPDLAASTVAFIQSDKRACNHRPGLLPVQCRLPELFEHAGVESDLAWLRDVQAGRWRLDAHRSVVVDPEADRREGVALPQRDDSHADPGQ